MDDQEEGQRPSTEVEYHCGPVPKVSGPPVATPSLARGGLSLQTRRQRRLQPPSGTLSPPTAVILESAFEQWIQSDNMEMPMFSLSEEPQQSAPTAVAPAAAAPAAEAVTGIRVFPAVSSKGVAEAPASSRARRRRRYLQERRRPAVLLSPLRRWGGRPGRPLLRMEQRH